MQKIENVEVWGFHKAIKGMRNSWNSWAASDSEYLPVDSNEIDHRLKDIEVHFVDPRNGNMLALVYQFKIGEADRQLAESLIKAGEAHHTFTDHIQAGFDLTLPMDVWKQMDRYVVGRQRPLSCSTMHTLTRRDLEEQDFDPDTDVDLDHLNALITAYNDCPNKDDALGLKNKINKSLPLGFEQMRTMQMNYTAIRRAYWQREGHPEPEWADFRAWAETLPNAWLITTKPTDYKKLWVDLQTEMYKRFGNSVYWDEFAKTVRLLEWKAR